MARTTKSPPSRELLKLKTRTKIMNYAAKNGWRIEEKGPVVFVGSAKCTFNSGGKLLMVE
jgi:hypothetical protein